MEVKFEMPSVVEYRGCYVTVAAVEVLSNQDVPSELTEGFLEFKFPDSYEIPRLDDEVMPIPRIVMNGREGKILKVNESTRGKLDITVSFD
jgi:hypothetical protein